MGRPSLYQPEYCERLIKHMKKGYSFESFAAIAGVCKQTLYTWLDVHPEFQSAKDLGTMYSLLWWERKGREGLFNESWSTQEGRERSSGSKSMNAAVWIFSMRNRFGWRNDPKDTGDDENESKQSGEKLSVEQMISLIEAARGDKK